MIVKKGVLKRDPGTFKSMKEQTAILTIDK